jgi:adenine-specific DNA-methyltransferase
VKRVVFDTNIYISAFITPGGRGETAYQKAVDGKIQLYSSVPILTELARKLQDKFKWDTDRVKSAVRHVAAVATVLKPSERKITETAPGLGGSFTYCTLGEPIEIENLLIGKGLPSFEALARYVFYTATGRSLETVAAPSTDGFIGETELFRIHLFYQPDTAWLRSNDAALNAGRVAAITKGNNSGKRSIVFAVAKFMSQKELTKERIEFCQLPYAVHRILGD